MSDLSTLYIAASTFVLGLCIHGAIKLFFGDGPLSREIEVQRQVREILEDETHKKAERVFQHTYNAMLEKHLKTNLNDPIDAAIADAKRAADLYRAVAQRWTHV